MRKEAKTKLTREKIISAALQEFGINGYESASVSAVCDRHNISKGLIYHNFHSKDDIYLVCVDRVFNELTDYIKNNLDTGTINPEDCLKEYLSARKRFFKENPLFLKIFCEAVMFPPAHLKEHIEEVKEVFDSTNTEMIKGFISNLKLRLDVSKAQVINTFCRTFDLIDAVSQLKKVQKDVPSFDENGFSPLDILLYGMIER